MSRCVVHRSFRISERTTTPARRWRGRERGVPRAMGLEIDMESVCLEVEVLAVRVRCMSKCARRSGLLGCMHVEGGRPTAFM